MSKRKADETEKLEGIGFEEVPENGFEVEETDSDEFEAFEADEEDKGESK